MALVQEDQSTPWEATYSDFQRRLWFAAWNERPHLGGLVLEMSWPLLL